ncbi:hypothetical protein BDW75DRAFT_206184 [Aspergillus navahoensis]
MRMDRTCTISAVFRASASLGRCLTGSVGTENRTGKSAAVQNQTGTRSRRESRVRAIPTLAVSPCFRPSVIPAPGLPDVHLHPMLGYQAHVSRCQWTRKLPENSPANYHKMYC